MEKKAEPIQFLATLPQTQSAIKRSGANEGMRVQLDIPESEMPSAIRLNLCGQRVLKVTVEVIEDGNQSSQAESGNKKRRWPSDKTYA